MVLSRDTTAPTVVVAVYYQIGFRVEPKDRTGFAHLFEHMMFQGSANLGKMEFIRLVQRNGGVLNGSTRFDFTNYFEVLPAHKLETALWAEADRMRGLDITQENLTNQQGVVMNEVKVNVLNQPYGGFPWLDLPQYANTNWHNAHNFYGDLKDLQAATLADVQDFFKTYYTPGNAVLVVVGDFEEARAKGAGREVLRPHSPARKPAAQPDLTEPRQTEQKRSTKKDALATKPALAFGYHMPARNTPEYYAMGLIDQILAAGRGQRAAPGTGEEEGLRRRGRRRHQPARQHVQLRRADALDGLADPRADQQRRRDPRDDGCARSSSCRTRRSTRRRSIARSSSCARRCTTSWRSSTASAPPTCWRRFALFDDDPSRINRLEAEFRKVTPALIQKTAQEYLRPTNRTVLIVEPGQAAPAAQE